MSAALEMPPTGVLAEQMSDLWIYILGEKTGQDIKIGWTSGDTLLPRLQSVNKDQTTNAEYVLLAGVRASRKDESVLKEYFAEYRRTDKGSRSEYFHPEPPLVEYAAWLRSRWWVAVDPNAQRMEYPAEDPTHWHPEPTRRHAKPPDDPTKMVQDYEVARGALPGPWSWFPNPMASFQDFFTPPELIHAARQAMGGIDLDAASHWAANRVHQIDDWFDVGRDAFKHDWHGRVWLNPPYGNNEPWFNRALTFIESGDVTQMCMLSPMWAFDTIIASDFMRASSALVLLSPTPKFWGNSEGRTGKNHPHGIVYVGSRVEQFGEAFAFDRNMFFPHGTLPMVKAA
jgi:DNA N-6-adenine-methyltransferase (Dam)